jgi:SAM-dependent methyltransferase
MQSLNCSCPYTLGFNANGINMSSKHTTPHYLQPYQDAVDKHGGTFEATLWRSKEGQVLRFEVFTREIDFTNTSILDVGCGIGDFAAYLEQEKIEFKSFIGIDAIQEMILTANERAIKNATFKVTDILKNRSILSHYDWAVFSGTLNAMPQDEAMELISNSFQACNVGVAFNFLSNQSWRDPATEDLRPASRFNTLELLKIAFSLTPNVSFTQTYLHGHDGTIVLRKHEVPQ